MSEAYILQFDVVAVVDIGDVDAYFIVLFSLHASREGHRLGLHMAEGAERGYGLHSFVGRHDGREGTIGIVMEFFHGHTAPESTATRQLARMIEEVGMTFVIGHAAVVGERFCVAQRHDLTGIGPRPSRRWCRAVADVLRHPAGSIKELVLFFVLNFIL